MKRTTTQVLKILLFGLLFPLISTAQNFTNVSVSAGVTVNHDGSSTDILEFSSGAAWFDFNRDGHLDLYVTMRTGPNFLYRNEGNGTFTEVADALNASDTGGDGGGVSIADINNDGWQDILLANADGNVLLKNVNGTNFEDITSTSGLDPALSSRTTTGSWGDYDGDGFLDLYIAQHVPTSGPNANNATTQDFLFHNNRDESFTNVSTLLDTLNLIGYGSSAGWTDFDNDGDMDILLVNECDGSSTDPNAQTQTRLFRNDGGGDPLDWRFTEVSVFSSIDDCRKGRGLAVGDYNRDGWMDYFYTNTGACVLYENDGNAASFSDVSGTAAIDIQNSTHASWGCSFLDYDNDGWQDLIVAMGYEGGVSPGVLRPNQVFHNDGDNTFSEVAASLGLADPGKTRNIVYGDYDNDGDLDAFIVNYGDVCSLMRNDLINNNHYLKIELIGGPSNRDGVGAKIQVSTPDGVVQHHEMRSGANLGGGDAIIAHFGLGGNTTVDEVKVTWPSGIIQTVNNLNADNSISITETNESGFTNVSFTSGVAMLHDGVDFPDMTVGTGAVWFDYNNDGFLDLYSTMRTSANKLYHNNGDGSFTEMAAALGLDDSAGNGAGVAVADFNNDGFQDLYLANGEEDRLFKNVGGTSFVDIAPAAGLLASGPSRGTSASWGDYDQDGYLDLYVSHHVQLDLNNAASTNQDFLFHNNGDETFTDVSNSLTIDPHLLGYGFIAGWTDYDNDGDADILLVNDCFFAPPGNTPLVTPTKLFRNDGGSDPLNWNFTEVSVQTGINDCRNGMGLAVGDYNRDGFMDYFYSNIGPIVLFKNVNGTSFQDVTDAAGVGGQPTEYWSWGTSFWDYDNDGWQDMRVAMGPMSVLPNAIPHPNLIYRNKGDGTFEEVGTDLYLGDIRRTRTMVHGDYDNDGDADLFVVNYGQTCALMRNDIVSNNHYLKVNLQGTTSNRDGIGSRLKLTAADGSVQYFETRSGSNLGGGDAIDAYFGLGSNTSVAELEIKWPSGVVQVIENIAGDQLLQVVESNCLPPTGSVRVYSGISCKISWAETAGSERNFIRYRPLGSTTWIENSTFRNFRYLYNLTPNTTYECQFKKRCSTNNLSIWTPVSQFTTPGDICSRPGASTVSNIGSTTARVDWDNSPDAIKYKIRYRPLGGSWKNRNVVQSAANLVSLLPGTTYQYQLSSFCSQGWTNTTTLRTFTTAISLSGDLPYLSAETEDLTLAITLYPNPAREVLNIDYGGLTPERLILKDLNGKTLLLPVKDQHQIDLSGLPAGIYFLNVLTDKQQLIAKKFIKH